MEHSSPIPNPNPNPNPTLTLNSMEKFFYRGGTTAFKVSVGWDKEESLDCSLVA